MPGPPDDDPISDAGFLFQDDVARRDPASKPAPATGHAGGEGGYDLVDDEPSELEPVPPAPASHAPTSPAPVTPQAAPRPRPSKATSTEEFHAEPKETESSARVDEVWTRWGEWKPTLLRLAGVALLWVGAFYLAISFEAGIEALFVILCLGAAAMLAVSYPIIITLERPVRMTPEQAVRDYFNALSHFRPHYRRMWLLLSSAGKQSREFDSFAGFQSYWTKKLAQLRGDKVKPRNALVFKVMDFRSEKSAGKSSLDVKFTIRIYPAGTKGGRIATESSVIMSKEKLLAESEHGADLASYRMAMGLVRGPDNMWYMNLGTLPD